jgi:hypothetical protein
MKCQNKREQLSEQVYMSLRTTNVVSEQIRTRVRICYYYRQNKIFSIAKQDITIARTTTYYYSRNKFVCHLEQNKKIVSELMRTTVRTKSYYRRNNFVCHLKQKQM